MKVFVLVAIYAIASIVYAFCNVRFVSDEHSNAEVMFWSDYYMCVGKYALFLVALPYIFKRKLTDNEMCYIYFILIFNAFNVLVYIGNRIITNNVTTTPYFFLFIVGASAFSCMVFRHLRYGKI